MTVNAPIPLIYNLFPRFYRTIDEWCGVVPHIKDMGFTAVFVNPFHETGLRAASMRYGTISGSIRSFWRMAPTEPISRPFRNLSRRALRRVSSRSWILSSTIPAIDSPLIKEHGAWYKRDPSGRVASPFAIDPGNPGSVTVWGDLASIDNERSSDRETLWDFWDRLVSFYQKIGFTGFRCDAAYQVPASLWSWLIGRAKKREAGAAFYAETLECRLDQIEALNGGGFDYLFNSVKWWHYDQSWVLDQPRNKHIAPSIAFAESHATERLAARLARNRSGAESRYAFTALFSKGILDARGV